MYSHVACDVMKERTVYLLKPSSLIWHLMPYLFLFITIVRENLANRGDSSRISVNSCPIRAAFGIFLSDS